MTREPVGPPVPWEYVAAFILLVIALSMIACAVGD
jgi:hypothetical protein